MEDEMEAMLDSMTAATSAFAKLTGFVVMMILPASALISALDTADCLDVAPVHGAHVHAVADLCIWREADGWHEAPAP